MSKIVFIKEQNKVYDGQFSQIGEHQVRLIFTDDVPSDSVLLSGFYLVNEYNGVIQTKRQDYTYLYRRLKCKSMEEIIKYFTTLNHFCMLTTNIKHREVWQDKWWLHH